ncbi:TonB-dependent receptor SusC [Kordia sp. SMS9]|uniref:carboxypeptidase-like regulatory domain-containing protein n=1 Tax=Kordia sp. SMS9 TaxID=2282170 RepID=UPI000E10E783|nr:carboxypeptidase-like regulatory domain-containing protein [Kordia sp. SMS9]AXG71031.1 TonB-dependent receptor SusC [Kordia sp. SMS9]
MQIAITKPCHEDWNQMSATEKGKFCNRCSKEVIDFTSKSDEEIIKHVSNHGHACGRFYASQLNRKLIADRKKRHHWLSYAASFLLPMTLFSQEKTSTEKKTVKATKVNTIPYKRLPMYSALERKAKTQQKVQDKQRTISGTVTDDTGIPLPAASIAIKGTSRGKATDFDGNYSIQVKPGDVLIVSYIGYDSQEIKVNADIFVFDIQMIPNNSLEEVVVVGGYWHNDSTSYASNYYETEEDRARKKRTKNYFAIQRKKWLEKRAKRRAKRAERKAKRNASNN